MKNLRKVTLLHFLLLRLMMEVTSKWPKLEPGVIGCLALMTRLK